MEETISISWKEYKKYWIGYIILLVLANIGDIVTTFVVLHLGGIEGNPAAAYMFSKYGLFVSVLIKLSLTAFVVWLTAIIVKRKRYTLAITLIAVIVGLTMATVISNFFVMLNYLLYAV
jgi:hypothetical protein